MATMAVAKTLPLIGSPSELRVTKQNRSLVYNCVPSPIVGHKSSFDLYVERFTKSALNSPRIVMSDREEYARKFRSRPNTRAPVVSPGREVKGPAAKRGTEGFFPRIKVRGNGNLNTTARTLIPAQSTNLEIAPSSELTSYYYRTPTDAAPSGRLSSRAHQQPVKSSCSRQCSYYIHPYPNLVPDVDDIPPLGGDLSYLPRPLKLAPKREVPFVYRHKIKRNMNVLFKIMASRKGRDEDGNEDSEDSTT